MLTWKMYAGLPNQCMYKLTKHCFDISFFTGNLSLNVFAFFLNQSDLDSSLGKKKKYKKITKQIYF